ncbi:PREDICTED: TBC1 domain family member 9B-like, partial [Dipodomys ordii]|uniref:TBC1 domain family member 9B-like n=1 Tax=Dipodomys ordii TaxID=10020 RepID=A0A1S3GWL4_DIPOR
PEALSQEEQEGCANEDIQEKRGGTGGIPWSPLVHCNPSQTVGEPSATSTCSSLSEKGTSPPDYRHYLRMWAKEKEAQKETIKDLPKMNQEQFIELCKTLYNMFSEDPAEQELYHAIATVASLLLRIGEVGKRFSGPAGRKPPREGPRGQGLAGAGAGAAAEDDEEPPPPPPPPPPGPQPDSTPERQPPAAGDPQAKAGGDTHGGKVAQESQPLAERGRGEGQGSPSQLPSDDEAKDDLSMSSYSVVSAGSLQCEDLADEDAGPPGGEARSPAAAAAPRPRPGGAVDADWCISFEHFWCFVLTEAALVTF